MTENPYAAPQTIDAPVNQPGDAEAVRKQYLSAEASIKSVGILYFLGGIAMLVAGVGILSGPEEGAAGPVMGAVVLALGVLQFILGAAVRKLAPWSKFGVGVISGIGLIGFPVGTLINGYILYLVLGKKGQMIFSQPYKEIIAATPHVRYKTSKAVWIILGIVVAVIILAIVAIAVGGMKS